MDDIGCEIDDILANARREGHRNAIFAAPWNRERRHADEIAGRLEIGVGDGRRIDAHRGTMCQQIADEAVQRSLAGREVIKVIARLPKMLSLVPAAG